MNMDKYRLLFIEESREHLSGLSRVLAEYENSNNKTPLVDEIFRHAHSIKGMAASMGYDPITQLAHLMEDVVAARRQAAVALEAPVIDLLLKSVDFLSLQVDCVQKNQAQEENKELANALEQVRILAPKTAPGSQPKVEPNAPATVSNAEKSASASATLRVRTDILDNLIDGIGELLIERERLRNVLGAQIKPEAQAIIDQFGSQLRALHERALAVRMTPVRSITERYPRLVRDLAQTLGKQVTLTVDGADIELDRAILDNLDTPLLHTLRNAVDHGIESPPERRKAEKSETGQIRISATRDRDSVLVEVTDDGRGLNTEALRKRAVELNLYTLDEAQNLSVRECYELICLPGFSTRKEVSDISGRGVGMDAVRSRIEDIGGTLDIWSETGHGCRFTFRIPLTLALVRVLLVDAGANKLAIPLAKIVAVRNSDEDTIKGSNGRTFLSFQHALAPVVHLSEILKLKQQKANQQLIVVEDGRDLSAVAVDGIIGYHEAVVKPLGDPLDKLECFSGATILGNGETVLILDVQRAMRLWAAA